MSTAAESRGVFAVCGQRRGWQFQNDRRRQYCHQSVSVTVRNTVMRLRTVVATVLLPTQLVAVTMPSLQIEELMRMNIIDKTGGNR